MATVQLRRLSEGRAYYDRKRAAGKSPMEAMRCLKRRLSDLVYKTMLDNLAATKATGPRGHPGQRLCIQRDRITAPHRLFGQVTSRTRQTQA
jgi:hypothetical protein